MSLDNQDYTVYQADSASIPFALQDDNGVAINLTGVTTIIWSLTASRLIAQQTPVLLQKTLAAAQIAIVNPPGVDGLITVTITNGDLAGLNTPAGTYYMEVFTHTSAGLKLTGATGWLTLKPSIVDSP